MEALVFSSLLCFMVSAEEIVGGQSCAEVPALGNGKYGFSCLDSFLPVSTVEGHTSHFLLSE
jgi:hypothetical protein